jgi:hypothetical protein
VLYQDDLNTRTGCFEIALLMEKCGVEEGRVVVCEEDMAQPSDLAQYGSRVESGKQDWSLSACTWLVTGAVTMPKRIWEIL